MAASVEPMDPCSPAFGFCISPKSIWSQPPEAPHLDDTGRAASNGLPGNPAVCQ